MTPRALTEAEFNEIVRKHWNTGISTAASARMLRQYHHTDVHPDMVRRAYLRFEVEERGG